MQAFKIHKAIVDDYKNYLNSFTNIRDSRIETFPFPQNLSQSQEQQIEHLGESYHEHRKQLLRQIAPEEEQLDDKTLQKQHGKDAAHLHKHLEKTPGTITFNEAVSGIQKLRSLHHHLDNAVLEAYGWQDHNFYELEYLPQTDRTRYTIHPDARREILKRLLELNHAIHDREVVEGRGGEEREYKKKKIIK